MITETSREVDLNAVLTDAHDHALAELEHGDPVAAIAWCSAHLAAADRVLHPVAQRRLPGGRRRLRCVRAEDHLLQQALCRLDRRLTGAVHLTGIPVGVLVQKVREHLHAHIAAEDELVDCLVPLLAPEERQDLAVRMVTATAAAPTRPHPHTRHTALSGLVARVDAAVDRVRDVMDNRVAPTTREPRPPLRPGRWGCYLMGVPYPPPEQQRAWQEQEAR